jgi:hypothetical protein
LRIVPIGRRIGVERGGRHEEPLALSLQGRIEATINVDRVKGIGGKAVTVSLQSGSPKAVFKITGALSSGR